MKLIEAMKRLKMLAQKVDDLKGKVTLHCADLSHETPVYEKQEEKIQEWLQSQSDTLKEILRLRVAIQRTNLATQVPIELGGVTVTKSIAEWIHRRKDLANAERDIWSKLTDRGLREGIMKTTQGQEIQVKIRRYFNPSVRDEKVALFRNEPIIIDSALEVVNAVTDLME